MKKYLIISALLLSATVVRAEERHWATSVSLGAGYQSTRNEILSPLAYSGNTFNFFLEGGHYGDMYVFHNSFSISSGNLTSSKSSVLNTDMDYQRYCYLSSINRKVTGDFLGANVFAGITFDTVAEFYSLNVPGADSYDLSYGDFALAPSVMINLPSWGNHSLRLFSYLPVLLYSVHMKWKTTLGKNDYPDNFSELVREEGEFTGITKVMRFTSDLRYTYRLHERFYFTSSLRFIYERFNYTDKIRTFDMTLLAGMEFLY